MELNKDKPCPAAERCITSPPTPGFAVERKNKHSHTVPKTKLN